MKQRIQVALAVFLLVFVAAAGRERQVYATSQKPLQEAQSKDVETFEGKGDVDVSAEMEKVPSAKPTDQPTTDGSTTKIGGKVIDKTGKGIKTGDVLTSAKTLAILCLGMGCLFLILRKKNSKKAVKE